MMSSRATATLVSIEINTRAGSFHFAEDDMDRYSEITRRIETSMRRDRFVVPAAIVAFAMTLFALLMTWSSLGSAVTASKVACEANPRTVVCRKA
jgi:hypothetical protein